MRTLKFVLLVCAIYFVAIGATSDKSFQEALKDHKNQIVKIVKNEPESKEIEGKSKTEKLKDKLEDFAKKGVLKKAVTTVIPKGGGVIDLLWPASIEQDEHAKAFEDETSAEWKFRMAVQETLTGKQTIHEALAERDRQMRETEKQLAKEVAQREAARRAETERQRAANARADKEARDRADGIRGERDRFESQGGNFRAPAGGH